MAKWQIALLMGSSLFLGRASVYLVDGAVVPPAVPLAAPAKLIGSCGGQVLSGMTEDAFPDNCEWIEPIRYDDRDGSTTWRDDTMPTPADVPTEGAR